MKTWLHNILFLPLIVTLTMAGSAYAQESGNTEMESNDADRIIEREKILYSPGEADTRYHSKISIPPSTGDSVTVNTTPLPPPKIKTEKQPPTPKPAVEKQSKEEDDSILSFNFLYYIIQKYKMQDIVD